MNVSETRLAGVLLLEPPTFADERGYFMESWQAKRYTEQGSADAFVQDNLVRSGRGVLRGMHAQYPSPQGKLVQVLLGKVYDVVVDIRLGSPTFGEWLGIELSEHNHRQLWIPAGFAHGYCVLSDDSLFSYKCSEYWNAETEFSIRWDDPDIGIAWPLTDPRVSQKDEDACFLKDYANERLPQWEC